MSISEKLVLLNQDIENAEAKIIEKGGSVTNNGSSNLADNIESIPTGGGEGWQRPSDWLPLPNDLETGEYIYYLYCPTKIEPTFFILRCTTTDASQWKVEIGLTDEQGNFTADRTEIVNSNTWYSELVPTTYTGYVWYRVSAVSGHIKTVDTRNSFTYKGVSYDYSLAGVLERLIRLPYADYYGTTNYYRYVSEQHFYAKDTLLNGGGDFGNTEKCVELYNVGTRTSTNIIIYRDNNNVEEIIVDESTRLWGEDVTSISNLLNGYYCLKELDLSNQDFQKITDIGSLFRRCYCLQKVKFPSDEKANISQLTSIDSYVFDMYRAVKFENFLKIPISFSISGLSGLTHSTLMTIINALPTVTNQTLTVGNENLNKLSLEDIEVATEKGWNIA